MLRTNLWAERELVNVALGAVKNIIYCSGFRPPGFTQALIVEFDDFHGYF